MKSLRDLPAVQIGLGIALRLIFIGGHAVMLPIGLVFERLIAREDRPRLWRLLARSLNRFIFTSFGLRMHGTAHIPSPTEHARLYISNHPTMIDGFLYFMFLGPEIIPLTAPAKMQIFPFNVWFPKMGIVDVARDAYDSVHADNAQDRHEAVESLVSYAVREQKSLLIFPEGHIEHDGGIHYIHTGAARVSIRAHVPIVPLVLANMDRIFLPGLRYRPGPVYVRVGQEIRPPAVARELPYRRAVKQYSNAIAQTLYTMIPARMLPSDLQATDPARIGVFVDIDRTLYKGYSQVDFLKFLEKRGKVARGTCRQLARYMLAEKLHLLSHDELMRRAYAFTNGWSETDLANEAEVFFKQQAVSRFVHNLLPILKDHAKRGHQIFLVSEVIRPLARHFKEFVGARDIAVTQLKKKNGHYTGEILQFCYGIEKAKRVEALALEYNVDLHRSYAYGDSMSDFPMLHSVRHAVVVRPKRALRREALAAHWPIVT